MTFKIGMHKVQTLPLIISKLQDYSIHVHGHQNKHYLIIEVYIQRN